MYGSKVIAVILLLSMVLPVSAGILSVEAVEAEVSDAPETWTVLSYMNGEGNLEDFIVHDLMEMERVGSSDTVDIVVQIDLGTDLSHRSLDATWTDTRRYHVEYHPEHGIGSTRLDDPPLGEINMDDPGSLEDFLTWGLSNYPADHYMIAIEGHADGVARGLMKDPSSTHSTSMMMSAKDLGVALRNSIDNTISRPVDIISFDVCWMGMAETAAEVMDHSLYMVGSFDEIPGAGWPYDKCLGALLNNTDIPLQERLSSIVDEYSDHYDLGGGYSYASLVAIDLVNFRDNLLEPLAILGEELYYSAYEDREIYDTLLTLVDKPNNRDDRYWDRYIDIYQYAELLSIDSRAAQRVRSAAASMMETEDDVIIQSVGGSNHPTSSRVFGIYYPTTKNDQGKYSPLVLSKLTAWDEHAALVVEDIDVKAKGVNWTYPNPGISLFQISSSTPGRINSVDLTIKLGDDIQTYSMIGSGGLYSKQIDLGTKNSVEYMYSIEGNYGTFTYPPDGYSRLLFQEESAAPMIWHSSPDAIRNSQTQGGLTFHVRDDSGVEATDPQGIARLEYREAGSPSWYSIPMLEISYDPFRGWIEYWALPTGITPGEDIEYHLSVSDIYGNEARFPASGEAVSKMAEGKKFYLDAYRSDISDHSLLIDRFSAMGMDVKAGTEPFIPDLSSFKGYVLVQPQFQMSETDVSRLLVFHENGGELLLVVDPNDPMQIVNSRWLMEALDMDVTDEGSVEGFFPSNQNSELAATLPSIGGVCTGSFVPSENMSPVYYTSPPHCAVMTGWYGKGRSVISIPCILNDRAMEVGPNRQLSELMISYLQENLLPTVVVDVDPPGIVQPGKEVTIDLSSSYDRDGEIVTYSVSVENSHMEGTEPVFSHIFYATGIYNVLVQVQDGEEGGSLSTFTIQVNRPPSTDHGFSTVNPHAGESVIFDYKGSDPDGDDIIVVWDFGDGYKTAGETVAHAYLQRGIYTYTMTVKDSNGLEVNKTGKITIHNSIPEAVIDTPSIRVNEGPGNFSGASMVTLQVEEGDLIFLPGELSFDKDKTDQLNLSWNMGDGTTLYGDQVSYRYETSGLYEIVLEADDGFGGVSNISQLVSVSNRAPFASFSYTDQGSRKVLFDASRSIDDAWDMDGLTYIWDFGDGNTMKTENPVAEHGYLTGGDYEVKLKVEDSDGDSDSYKIDVDVDGLTKGQVLGIIFLVLLVLGGAAVIFSRRIIADRRSSTEEMDPDESRNGGFSRPVKVRGRRPAGDWNLIDNRGKARPEIGMRSTGKHEGSSPFRPPREP